MLRFSLMLGICGAILTPLMAEADPAPAPPKPAPEKRASATSAGREACPPPRIPAGDPFAMRGLADDEGFVSAGPAAIPKRIRAVGILAMKGEEPVGALSIPGSPSLHFVRKGDILQVDPPSESGSAGASGTQLYLLVKSVTPSQIEIAPRTRPQDVRIYR